MHQPKFAIPPEFQEQLRFRPCPDTRSDIGIMDALAQYQQVTTEKNLWAFWHSGVKQMPDWCQRNVINWVRLNGSSGWTIRILDAVPDSPNYALKYLPADMLPQAFVDGQMEGPYVGPHSADFLRGACLYLHGGVYMDVGNIEIRELDRICWSHLEDPESPYQVSTPWMYGTTMANHFVAARKGDPFIKRWHELFVHLWQGHTDHTGLIETPLFAPLQEGMSFDDSRASDFHWDFKVDAKTVMNYITQVLCWQRLCMLDGTDEDPFSGVDYWTKHVLIFDVLQECWGGEATLSFKGFGQRMFDLMNLPLDGDQETQDFRDAYKLTWRLLTQSSIQKITHGKGLTHDLQIGVLWDEHPGKDCTPGTFAELLRYGQVNFEQTRGTIKYVDAPRPGKTLKKGLLES